MSSHQYAAMQTHIMQHANIGLSNIFTLTSPGPPRRAIYDELPPCDRRHPAHTVRTGHASPTPDWAAGVSICTEVGTGWNLSTGDPRPSCPEAAAPQLCAAPPRIAMECCRPAATARVLALTPASA